MEDYEIDRLRGFVERYENAQKHGFVVKRNLTIDERDTVDMLIIDFCCITSQNMRDSSSWQNADINKYVETHQTFYTQLKTIRDSFIAHLDHSKNKLEKVSLQSKMCGISASLSLNEFYKLCKQLIASEVKYEND